MGLPPLAGMPPWLQHMIEQEPRRVVYVERKRFRIGGFFIKLIFYLIIGLVVIILLVNYFPGILKMLGGVI